MSLLQDRGRLVISAFSARVLGARNGPAGLVLIATVLLACCGCQSTDVEEGSAGWGAGLLTVDEDPAGVMFRTRAVMDGSEIHGRILGEVGNQSESAVKRLVVFVRESRESSERSGALPRVTAARIGDVSGVARDDGSVLVDLGDEGLPVGRTAVIYAVLQDAGSQSMADEFEFAVRVAREE
jgi:hypothetical protein